MDLLFIGAVIALIVYGVGVFCGMACYTVSDEGLKGPLNVWIVLQRGVWWPWFLAIRLSADAARITTDASKIHSKTDTDPRTLRSGQESGLYK